MLRRHMIITSLFLFLAKQCQSQKQPQAHSLQKCRVHQGDGQKPALSLSSFYYWSAPVVKDRGEGHSLSLRISWLRTPGDEEACSFQI